METVMKVYKYVVKCKFTKRNNSWVEFYEVDSLESGEFFDITHHMYLDEYAVYELTNHTELR